MGSPSSMIAATKYCFATIPQRDLKASSMRYRRSRRQLPSKQASPGKLHLPLAVVVDELQRHPDHDRARLHQANSIVLSALRKAAW